MMFDGGKITNWKQGDYEFSIRQMNPFKAMKVLGELQKIIIPAVGGAVAGLQDSSDNAEIVATVGGALGQLATSLDGDKLERACKLLLDCEYLAVKESGKTQSVRVSEDELEAIYTGRPWDMLALCYKIFEVNFLDFSASSSVPIGVRNVVKEIRSQIMGVVGTTSAV
jgi:hypothetical protein